MAAHTTKTDRKTTSKSEDWARLRIHEGAWLRKGATRLTIHLENFGVQLLLPMCVVVQFPSTAPVPHYLALIFESVLPACV